MVGKSGRIEVNTLTLSQAGKNLENNARSIQNASDDAGKFVKNQLSFMVSRRVEKDIQYWEDLKKDIDNAVILLLRVSKELNEASKDFRGADEGGGLNR